MNMNVLYMSILRRWVANGHLRSEHGRQERRRPRPKGRSPRRVMLYSPGMVGFGHIRRNASIAQALRSAAAPPTIVMIAEARQAGSLPMPDGVDCVTLPSLRKKADGSRRPRFLDLSEQEVVALRATLIGSAIRTFDPDVFIVDHLPLGAAGELEQTLQEIRREGRTRCVLGLRDVLQDPATVRETWRTQRMEEAVRDYYDAVWIYGDPRVYDAVHEYNINGDVGHKVRYTGYLDARQRVAYSGRQASSLLAGIPPGRLVLCLVGGGQDGRDLAETFLRTDLPGDTTGVLVTGPFMPRAQMESLRDAAHARSRLRVVEFIDEPAPLIQRADRVIAMGGYNTMCEVLSFRKRALIVPRVAPKPEQWIRAERFRQHGLIDVLHPDALSPDALSAWLGRRLGPPPSCSEVVQLDGLQRIPDLLEALYEKNDRLGRSQNGSAARRMAAANAVLSILSSMAWSAVQ
jgi:predicted glycosyltransferase